MSKDKRDSYVILRGKVDDIRIQNITALLFMYEGNQKILLDKKNYRKYIIHINFMKKTFLHYIFQSTEIKK